MTTEMLVHFPEDFPLRGIERDAFEARLRDALHYVFNGRRVQQLADQVDARRVVDPVGALPLRQIGDVHAFEQCMSLDHCRFEDMSAALRHTVLNAVGERLGLSLTVPGLTPDAGLQPPALELAREPASKSRGWGRRAVSEPVSKARVARDRFAVILVPVVAAGSVMAGAAGWKWTHPSAAPVVATVVSTSSPAQTLRELASSVPDDRQPYRVSVQIEPQAASTPVAH